MSDSLWPNGLQHTRLPCASLSPSVCSDSCSLSWSSYLTISSSATPFSFCLHSPPASGPFPLSWLFASGSQSMVTSASASVFQMNIQSWFPLGLTRLISLQFNELSRVFYRTTIQKHQFFHPQPSLWSNYPHLYTTTGNIYIFLTAAAAKSLQLCPTLCNPIDGSPPGSSVHGLLQARILECVAISFSSACMHAKSLQSCLTLCDPMDSTPPGSSVHRIL